MSSTFHKWSRVLYTILDSIGASDSTRTKYWEYAMTLEILAAVKRNGDESQYMFGSRCEGTTTQGLDSDEDMLTCRESELVVENIEVAPVSGVSYLMISDNTKPGYFNLQVVFDGVPHTIYQRELIAKREDTDLQGRILRKHVNLNERDFSERNGPAHTHRRKNAGPDTDLVFAYTCKNIPTRTDLWLRKHRPYNWPSKSQLGKMRQHGCFFVGVGHPHSESKSTEWRISFSLQERELMSSLNPTQHKCYILLKLIKKDIIHPRAGDKSISSYHLKTVLFHIIENSRPGIWTRRNLIQGTRVCLAILLSWVKRGNCPNYFIPEENMFDRLNRGTLDKVAEVLRVILKSGVKFLLSLHSDDIGNLVFKFTSGGRLDQIRKVDWVSYCICLNLMQDALSFRNKLLRSIGNIEECIAIVNYLESVKHITDHKQEDVKRAIKLVVPHFHLQIAQFIASRTSTNIETSFPYNAYRAFVHCIRRSEECDMISSKLIFATCNFRTDFFGKCEEILLTCETSFRESTISVCCCYNQDIHGNGSLLQLIQNEVVSFPNLGRQCIAGCMLFLPAQSNLVHPALRLEMYRSVYTPPGSRDENKDYWFDWILVDSRVYLYFLQYLLYAKTNKHIYKNDAIENLVQLINTDDNLGHRETACNLLGWICSQENRVQEAFGCFQESWRTRPVHNSAKWHLLVMLTKVYRQTVSA